MVSLPGSRRRLGRFHAQVDCNLRDPHFGCCVTRNGSGRVAVWEAPAAAAAAGEIPQAVMDACKDDYEKHCIAHAPEGAAARDCMAHAFEKLSDPCVTAILDSPLVEQQSQQIAKAQASEQSGAEGCPRPQPQSPPRAPRKLDMRRHPKILRANILPAKIRGALRSIARMDPGAASRHTSAAAPASPALRCEIHARRIFEGV